MPPKIEISTTNVPSIVPARISNSILTIDRPKNIGTLHPLQMFSSCLIPLCGIDHVRIGKHDPSILDQCCTTLTRRTRTKAKMISNYLDASQLWNRINLAPIIHHNYLQPIWPTDGP